MRQDRSTKYTWDVFLSHNSKDKPAVRRLAERLRGDGLAVWLDDWEIKAGDSIPSKVMSGLENSRVLLLLLSQNFDESDWAEYESGSFLFRDPKNTERRFIPVRLDQSPVREALQHFAWVDWWDERDDAYQRLVDACRPGDSTATGVGEHPRSTKTEAPKRLAEAAFSLGHTDMVRSVAISADGNTAVTGCADGVVRVYDLQANRCTAALEGHIGEVNTVAITPDGLTALSGADDDTVKVWDLAQKTCSATLEGHTALVWSVAVTADGLTALSGAGDNTVKVWDLAQKACTATLEGHTTSVLAVAITSDGLTALSGAQDDTVKVWDLAQNTCAATLEGHTDHVWSVAVTPDGLTALSGAEDGTLKVWDLAQKTCAATLQGHTALVWSVAVTSDGLTALSGADDSTVKVWDLAQKTCSATLEGHTDGVMSVAVTSDGFTALSSDYDSTVNVWDLTQKTCSATLQGHTGEVTTVAVTPDGLTAISSAQENTVKVWDLAQKTCSATLQGHNDEVNAVAVTPDGLTAISGADDNTVKVWDLAQNTCSATLEGHGALVWSVAVTPDGLTAISGAADNTVKVWDLAQNTCAATLVGHIDSVTTVSITPDGRTALSGGRDNAVKIWDLAQNTCVATLEGHTGSVFSVAITPDALTAISGAQDNTVKVWDLTQNICSATLEGHIASVLSVAVTPDGLTALSGAADNIVRVWDLAQNTCSATFEGHTARVNSVLVTPAAPFQFVSAAENGVLRFWQEHSEDKQAASLAGTRYTNAKVLLVGESRVGKTGLAMRIATGQWEPTDSTDGHWATRLDAEHTDSGWALQLKAGKDITAEGVHREIWLWDFAGQADYRLIHQLFMDRASLVVLVFNPQSDRLFDSLGRWDHDIKRAAQGRYRKLLVAARTDVGGLRASKQGMDEFLENQGFAGYLETSAKNNIGIPELEQAMVEHIDWDKLEVIVSNEIFDQLKTAILSLRDAGNVLIRLGDLNERLRLTLSDLTFTHAELSTVVGHLAAPGLVWHLDFGDFILLQPEKINCYASAVIRTLRDADNDLGIIGEDDVEAGRLNYKGMERLAASDEQIVLQAMHQTFIKRGLCIQQKTEGGTQLVFPAFFGAERPEDPDSPPLLATYAFSGFLDDVYATLVVRLHHVSALTKHSLWKDYAQFTVASGAQVAVQLKRGKEGRGSLLVHCDPSTPEDDKVLFNRYVHEHVEDKGEKTQRTRHYVCTACGRVYKDDEETREVLAEDGEHAAVACTSRKCKAQIPLWDAVERKFASQEFKNRVRLLREASQIAIDNESRELILEGHAKAIAGEAGQIYRALSNSDHGIDGEIEFKDYSGNASGQRLYLQLKSGDAHLRNRQRDKTEVFDIRKPRWADYWIAQAYPVMLVVRTSDKRIRWFNASAYLQKKKDAGEWPVKQIIFEAEDFSPLNIIQKRRDILGPPPERIKT